MRKTVFVFLILLVLLAFADIRFSIGGRGIFTLSLFEAWAYACLLPMIATHRLAKHAPAPPSRWLYLYLAWAFVAALLFWDNPDYSIQMDLKNLLPGFLAYALLLMAVESGRDLSILVKSWVAAGVVNACLAASQFFLSGPYPVSISDTAYEKLDLSGEQASVLVTGFFSHPNSFAQIMIPWFVVAGVAWLTSRKFMAWRTWVWFLLSIVFGAALFMTMVKGALLWSAAGIMLGVLMSKWKRARSLFVFAALWAALVGGIIAVSAFLVDSYGIESLGTLRSRVDFVVAGWNLFLDNPVNAVLGGGIRFWESYSDTYSGWQFENAHNVYINQILDYGLIGTGLLAAFVLSTVRNGLRYFGDGHGALSPYPYIGALLAMTGEYFFEPSFNGPIQKYQLFFVVAAVILTGRVGLYAPARADEPVWLHPYKLEPSRLLTAKSSDYPEAGAI